MWSRIVRQFQEVNKELWLLLMMFAILAGVNYLISSQRMLLGFYVLPSVYSAYFRGRRHATLTALLSLLLVVLIVYTNPHLVHRGRPRQDRGGKVVGHCGLGWNLDRDRLRHGHVVRQEAIADRRIAGGL